MQQWWKELWKWGDVAYIWGIGTKMDSSSKMYLSHVLNENWLSTQLETDGGKVLVGNNHAGKAQLNGKFKTKDHSVAQNVIVHWK